MEIAIDYNPYTGQPQRWFVDGETKKLQAPNDPKNRHYREWERLNLARDIPFSTHPITPTDPPKVNKDAADYEAELVPKIKSELAKTDTTAIDEAVTIVNLKAAIKVTLADLAENVAKVVAKSLRISLDRDQQILGMDRVEKVSI